MAPAQRPAAGGLASLPFEGSIGPSQAMVVYKLAADRTSCIVAVVADDRAATSAPRPERLTAKMVPGFRAE